MDASKVILGLFLVASPLIGIAAFAIKTVGLLATIGAFALTALILVVITIGSVLLYS